MSLLRFVSAVRDRGEFAATFPSDVVKNEPMFFNVDLSFCFENGGPLTRSFIQSLPSDWKSCNPVIDSRVHMLMPGWFPAIPGFHHDDVPRTMANGQPNYVSPEYHSEHLTGLVNAEIAPTLFALGEHQLPLIPDKDYDGKTAIVYRIWHPLVEKQLADGTLTPWSIVSGRYIEFDWQSMHTATRAVGSGWRWFIRLSRKTARQSSMTNEIRRQVQVYMHHPMDGW
jgi:hypothetical protein